MPLESGSSDDVIARNIEKLIKEGYNREQAIAIAYEKAGRSRKRGRKNMSGFIRVFASVFSDEIKIEFDEEEAETGDDVYFAAKVTAEDRKKHSAVGGGRFPIFNKATARSAIRLRGHANGKEERRKILNRAAQYLPDMAKKAREEDKKKGLI